MNTAQVKEVVQEGGVVMKILEKGDGWKKPKNNDKVQVKYKVTLAEDWTLQGEVETMTDQQMIGRLSKTQEEFEANQKIGADLGETSVLTLAIFCLLEANLLMFSPPGGCCTCCVCPKLEWCSLHCVLAPRNLDVGSARRCFGKLYSPKLEGTILPINCPRGPYILPYIQGSRTILEVNRKPIFWVRQHSLEPWRLVSKT
eukprot:SAG31_NODE_2575_length_5453_cov_7.045013_8_plen_200_part_00